MEQIKMKQIIMEQIDIDEEIQRIEAMYKHYKLLYRKIAFLCCSGETKRVRNLRNSLKKDFKKIRQIKQIRQMISPQSNSLK